MIYILNFLLWVVAISAVLFALKSDGEASYKLALPDIPKIAGILGAALFMLLLTSCATTEPAVREVTVIKEVPVPYHQPCPAAADKPVVPKRVAVDHPVLPGDPAAVARILADKVLELFGYADEADGVMTACSKQRGAPVG